VSLGVLDTHLLPHGSAIVNTIQQLAGAAGIALSFSLVSATTAVYREQGHSAATSMAQGTQWVYLAGSGLLLHKIDIKRTRLTSRTLKTYFLCLRRESAPSTQQALIQD
jgi:hypothetical protein